MAASSGPGWVALGGAIAIGEGGASTSGDDARPDGFGKASLEEEERVVADFGGGGRPGEDSRAPLDWDRVDSDDRAGGGLGDAMRSEEEGDGGARTSGDEGARATLDGAEAGIALDDEVDGDTLDGPEGGPAGDGPDGGSAAGSPAATSVDRASCTDGSRLAMGSSFLEELGTVSP